MKLLDERDRRTALQAHANYALFANAAAESIRKMIEDSKYTHAPRGELVIRPGQRVENVYFLLEGVARIYHQNEDREFTAKLMEAPNHFGDIEQICGYGEHRQFVEMLTDGKLAVVPWPTMRRLFLEDHGLCVGWLVGLASQFMYTTDAGRHHVFLGLQGQIANVLVSYGRVFGKETRRGIELGIPLSLEEIGKQVGSVKRAVYRVIEAFAKRGIIDTSGRNIVVTRNEELLKETLPRGLGLDHRARTTGLLDAEDEN